MPHDLATTNGQTAKRPNGQTAMMYAGQTLWHGPGIQLDEPATAAEAIEAAGLNYYVDLTPIETVDEIPVPKRQAVVRDDTQ